jgi:hypothetical protein
MVLAGLFGALSLLFIPLGLLSTAVLALVVLRLGWWAGWTVAAGAAVPIALGWWLIPMKPGVGVPPVLGLWIAAYLAAWVLRGSESQGKAAAVVTALSALLVLALHLLTGDPVDYWQSEQVGAAMNSMPGVDEEDLREVGAAPRLLGGVIGLMLGLTSMASVLLARWWQSLLYNPGGFGAEFCRLTLPRIALPLTVVVLLSAGWVDTSLLDDFFIVSLTMYFFAGLAVIHGIAARRKLASGWLVPPYLGLIVMPQFFLIGLAFLGALDVIANFRALPRRG